VTVWRSTQGGAETQILSTSAAAPLVTSATTFGIAGPPSVGEVCQFDNIRVTSGTQQVENVLASYDCVLDDLYNVLKMSEADGTYWRKCFCWRIDAYRLAWSRGV
jgi:hypothetical protein